MTSHIDQEELMKKASEIKEAVREGAEKAFEKASEATMSGVKTAKPHVMQAVDTTVKTATPYVDTAAEKAAKLTAKAGEALDHFHDEMMKDYLPRLATAVEEAAEKAKAEVQKATEEAAEKVVDSAPMAAVEEVATRKRRGKTKKILGCTLIAGAAAGAGYLVWRRSQPIEDPWAEEYWADLEADVPVEEVTPEEVVAEAEEAGVVAEAEEITEEAAGDDKEDS